LALFGVAFVLGACGSGDGNLISSETISSETIYKSRDSVDVTEPSAPTITTSTTEPTTSTESAEPFTLTAFVKVGQCFVYPDALEFNRLETPECDNTHDAQIYYDFDTPDEFTEDSLLDVCEENLDEVSDGAIDNLSEEATYEYFTIGDPVERILCIVYDPSGLYGSVLAG